MARHEPNDEAVAAFLAQLAQALGKTRGARSFSWVERETGIDRQKLAALQEKRELSVLSPRELIALNSFLSGRFGHILNDLRGTTMVDLFSEAQKITFILGARELQWADHVSRWDVRAMTTLSRLIRRQSEEPPDFEVEDALVAADGLSAEEYLAEIAKDNWFGLLDQYDGRAIVALGSPRASHAAEYMLAAMFGEEPFGKPNRNLPFAFLWTEGLRERVRSTFARTGRHSEDFIPRSGLVGMLIDGQTYVIDDRLPSWDTYGVGVVQRRRSGQLWVVMAGATGTATASLAELLPNVRSILPAASNADSSAPVWFGVAARVRRDQTRGGDNRVVTSQHVLVDTMTWDRVKGRSNPPPSMRR